MNILLHLCCANCAIFPVRLLREQNHRVTGFFFNPNIHPYQEFQRRLAAVRDYSARVELEVRYRADYALEEFLAQVAADYHRRCDYCYASRLEETAKQALAGGYDAFSTSLLYSRYQRHDQIRDLGESLGRQYGLPFVYQDFRSGWRSGIDTSKAMGLYRQQYCGCIYSEKDRYCPHSRN